MKEKKKAISNHLSGFSLVEVVLAIGIVAFALIAIVALVPMSLRLAGESEDETRAANLLGAIIAERQSTPISKFTERFKLEALTNAAGSSLTNSFGITDDGEYSGSDMGKARYRVSYTIKYPPNGRADPCILWLRVSWPAQNTNSPGFLETVAACNAL